MLPANSRLTSSDDFRTTVRKGVRVGRETLVLHAVRSRYPGSRAGFIVSKAVGNAVTRNRVKRRLRHLAASCLADSCLADSHARLNARISSPAGSSSADASSTGARGMTLDVVVRALPRAVSGDVRGDFLSAWDAALEKLAA